MVRHPYDVVRSRQEVQTRLGAPFEEIHAQVVAEEYVRYCEAALASDFAGPRLVFRYEGLNKPDVQAGIARFVGVDDLHARPMWGRSLDRSGDAWHSPKYFQPIDLERRLSPLAENFKRVTRAICGPLMKQFGYGELDVAA